MSAANLSRAILAGANVSGADLSGSRLTIETKLTMVTLSTTTSLADIVWDSAPLTQIAWEQLPVVGDEVHARQQLDTNGKRKDARTRLWEYATAVRAYRLLAVALRNQGLNEHADRFDYRAQFIQRQVLRRQGNWGRALGSWLLDVIAGYGYKPMRSVITYLLVILSFAAAYFALTNFGITPFLPSHSSPLPWYEATVLSVSSFHGRGLFPTGLSLGDPIAILAAFEAIIGLLIEITFIATFTQRFFAR
jgi:Pentapeptide repeats (8 copies)